MLSRVLTDVAVVVADGVAPFELGLLAELFGYDRREDGVPLLGYAVCGAGRRAVRSSGGFSVQPDHDLDRVAQADLVAVPAFDGPGRAPQEVVEVVRAAAERGARVLSVCSGAFVLGEAGLLDDRSCTTHWRHTAELVRRFPRARVMPEVLYVDDGPVVTSAGTAAGFDAGLHLWREEHGAAVASAIARRLVVPLQREGGQAQYVARPVAECDADTLAPLLAWAAAHLDDDLGVEALARRAHLSPRTFARRFRDETGTTPHAWVTSQRLAEAERLLETTDRSVEQVAHDVGFAGAATLRHQFQRARGVSPQSYRRAFRCAASA